MVIGETLAQAAERELFEETGLKLKARRALGFFSSRVYKRGELSYHANLVPVLMRPFPFKARLQVNQDEHSDSRFINPKHLSRFELVSNNETIVKIVCKYLNSDIFAFREISYKE